MSKVAESICQQQVYSTILFFQNDFAQLDFNISILTIKNKEFQKSCLRDLQEVP